MQFFTGKQYHQIAIANEFGLDKETWNHRLDWFHENYHRLESLVEHADEPYLMAKAVIAYREAENGIPIGFNMHLDATASGLQWLAILSGCPITAKAVNLVNTGKREDVYKEVAKQMSTLLRKEGYQAIQRKDIKDPMMTHWYNKLNQENLSEAEQQAFYTCIEGAFPGAKDVMDITNTFWDKTALSHSWSLPDGHKVIAKVKEKVNARIEIDELDGTSMTYRFEANQPSYRSSSLMPCIIHSIDGYAVREMVRRAYRQGFQLAHIHDAFTFHPNYGNMVRQNYIDILCEIADSNLLSDILSEISGSKVILKKDTNDLSKLIKEAEYPLS